MYGAHVADLFVVNFGDDNERARRAAEREASRARVRGRYTELLRQSAGLDEASAQLAMAVLFDHFDERGEACLRSCHPKLPDEGDRSHDVCFDCPCTWNSERREREKAKSQDFWDEWHNGPEAEARRVASDLERGAVQEWISAPPGRGGEADRFGVSRNLGGQDRRPFVLLPRTPRSVEHRDRPRTERQVRQPLRGHI